jgi:hypothetical protein
MYVHFQVPLSSSWRWSGQSPPKRQYPTASLYGVKTQRTSLPTSSFHPEEGCSKVLRNVGILPHHYRTLKHKTPDMPLHLRENFKPHKRRVHPKIEGTIHHTYSYVDIILIHPCCSYVRGHEISRPQRRILNS